MDALVNVFYRFDPPIPDGAVTIGGQRWMAIDAVEPSAILAQWLARSRAMPYDQKALFHYVILVRDASGWVELDPQDGRFPSNQWGSFARILLACGLRFFDDAPAKLPGASTLQRRFDMEWSVEERGADTFLRIRRRKLNCMHDEHAKLFTLLTNHRIALDSIPPEVERPALERIGACLSETVHDFPLEAFAMDAKRCLERAVILHHQLFAASIDEVQRKAGGDLHHPQEILPYHLAPYSHVLTDRARLLERLAAAIPGFQLHPLLAEQRLTQADEPSRETISAAPSRELVREPIEIATADGPVGLEPVPGDPDLHRMLDFVSCQVEIARYRIVPASERPVLDAAGAAHVVTSIEELRGQWTTPPVAAPADLEEFWGSDSRGSLLRYALYSPPYGGAGPLSISLLEPEIFRRLFGGEPLDRLRIWQIDPATCTWFINEWWDYLWVCENPGRGELLVLMATATD